MCKLAEALARHEPLDDIEGISYKLNGKIISNKPRDLRDINTLKPVSFDLLEMERYIFEGPLGKRSIFWNSSQGCPYHCGFCSTAAVYRRRWSGLNAASLLGQIKKLASDYNIDGIAFAEDNFFVDVRRVEELCRGLIKNKTKIKWASDARIDQINRFSGEFMCLLKESGCRKLYIGAESGDQETLDLIDKKIRLEDTYKTAEKLDSHKIISEFFIIVGFPLNPEKDLKNSLELIKKIKLRYPDHQFTAFLYTPYPGTPLLDLAVKKGFVIPKTLEGWSDWSILSVNTPWIDKKYLDTVNMYSKCFYLLAFPSASLRSSFKKGFIGLVYFVLHKLAGFRVKNNFFALPLEWKLIKIFYKLKIRFNVFKNIESFR